MSEKLVQIQCRGRDSRGQEVLDTPVSVNVSLAKREGTSDIRVDPMDCPHSTGGYGQRCKASRFKVGWEERFLCPFSFDYPYALEFVGWSIPTELAEAIKEMPQRG